MLCERLQWLDGFTARRRAIADHYDQRIRHPRVRLLAPPIQAASHARHLYVILCESREALAAHLAQHGVQTLIHYPVPVHRQSPCQALARDPHGLSHTEIHAESCLSIPCHPQMSDTDVDAVTAAVNSFKTGA